MPGVTQKSALAGVLKGKMTDRLIKSRSEPPKPDAGGTLPPGIDNGIAKLVSISFQKVKEGAQNAGKPIFVAAGIVVSPESVNGVPVKGRRTSVMEMLFETPGKQRATFEDHVDWVMNLFKCLGADLSELQDLSELETVYGPALVEAGPYFSFRTSQGKATKEFPNPRTFENWGQVVEYQPEEGESTGVDDSTPVADPVGDQSGDAGDGEPDVDALLVASNDGDEAAQTTLREKAEEVGATVEWMDAADTTWEQIAEVVRTGEAPKIEDVPADPAKGDVYDYTPIDPKTKKPMVNPKTKRPLKVEGEIKSVDKKSKTVLLIDTASKKEYKGVKWDELIAK